MIEDSITEIGIIKISRTIALLSLVFGTIILCGFYASKNSLFAFFGLFYVIIALIINSVFLVGLILKLIAMESNKKQTLISMGIMLFNIPVVIIYYNLAMGIMSTIID